MTTFRHSTLTAAGMIALAAALTACDNGNLTSLNANPNSPESAPAGPVFTNATQTAAARWLGITYDQRQMELVAQHMAENQYPDADRYSGVRATNTQGNFNGAYVTELKDFAGIIQTARANKQPGLYGPAIVMQQWDFGYLTDSWGDVPYSNALAGDSTTPVLSPTYDAQKDIYAAFFTKLAAATTDMAAATGPTLGAADPVYQGSLSKWEKFSNSLRARYALRLANVDPAKASAELTAAFNAAGGTFADNADNATIRWPGDGVFNNPWSDNYISRDDHRMSKTMIDILQGNNDPRLPVFAQPAQSGGGYVGQPNGLSASAAGPYAKTTSRPGLLLYPTKTAYGTFPGGTGPTQPSYYMTNAEVQFIKAEAAQRGLGGLTPAQAAGFYNAGITASMNQWGVTNGVNIATYLAQPSIAYQGGLAGLKQIAVQKWIALYTDGGQAWFEWRRTCQPSTIVPGPAAVFSYVPRRLEYPITEATANGDNLKAAIARQGPDDTATPVYWDKKSASPQCQ
jgi:hypothetical protein